MRSFRLLWTHILREKNYFGPSLGSVKRKWNPGEEKNMGKLWKFGKGNILPFLMIYLLGSMILKISCNVRHPTVHLFTENTSTFLCLGCQFNHTSTLLCLGCKYFHQTWRQIHQPWTCFTFCCFCLTFLHNIFFKCHIIYIIHFLLKNIILKWFFKNMIFFANMILNLYYEIAEHPLLL